MLRIAMIGLVFVIAGASVETLGLIEQPAHWAMFGYVFGLLTAYVIDGAARAAQEVGDA